MTDLKVRKRRWNTSPGPTLAPAMAYGNRRSTVPRGWGQWLDSAVKRRFDESGRQWAWADLARAMDVKPNTIRRWIAGGLPEATKVLRLAQVLRVDAVDLLKLMEGAVQTIQTAPQQPPGRPPGKARVG